MVEESPLISVVTPVYNGESYISECIESVLSQTYSNWEYIIVDNCSTDRSLEIARKYAIDDVRIRVHSNVTCLELLSNWNHALRQISPSSKYCKVVHADDKLLPDCLRLMLEVSEQNPSVGIVGAYRIDEDHVNLDDVPYPGQVFTGHEICRRRLLGGDDVFGSPTSLFLRADLVRSREKFYNENNFHADTEICFDLLKNSDFGFVHQVLTYTRRHNESQTSFARVINTHAYSHIYLAEVYGDYYLNSNELEVNLKKKWRYYYRSLNITVLRMIYSNQLNKLSKFWDYHSLGVKNLGYSLSISRMIIGMFECVYILVLKKLRI